MSTSPRTFLSSSSMNPCTLIRDWVWGQRPDWMCVECGEVRSGTEGVDLFVQESRPEKTPLNMVSGCGVGVIQTAFLAVLIEAAGDSGQALKIGRVLGPGNTPLNEWRSVHGDPRVIVRGEERAGSRRCNTCGRCHYYAEGKRYLCPPPPSVDVLYAGLGTLIVSERIRNRIAIGSWPMLEFERLPVLDEPVDGLPRDLCR